MMSGCNTEPIDRGAGGPSWEEVRHSKATGWDSAGRATWLTVKPWYWRFMVFQVADEMIGHASQFYDTHGAATSVPYRRCIIVWPKPAHLAVCWSERPLIWLARLQHRTMKAAGHRDRDGEWCSHPLMRWRSWLIDNVYECQWIRVSPMITVHYA